MAIEAVAVLVLIRNTRLCALLDEGAGSDDARAGVGDHPDGEGGQRGGVGAPSALDATATPDVTSPAARTPAARRTRAAARG